jgi:glutamate--cysteine ligase
LNIHLDTRLDLLVRAGQQHLLHGGLKGLEKESLRITPTGHIAQTPHPPALGSALTHPWITTDYSEALIELITPPHADVRDTLDFLTDLHRFVYRHIGDELLLATSMPCEIEGDASIPIASYGRSNIGHMKQVYRHGLDWRYGRAMQAIAGIHFNYSVNEALWPVLQDLLGATDREPDRFVADQYFALIRNVHRHGWLILYLFGASPALCASFLTGRADLKSNFSALDAHTLYRPYATSLRMSDIGYRNDSQAGLDISFDHLDDYVASLTRAIQTPYPAYERIGVKVGGRYRQLNANILQIENEYYSAIRPKQITRSGEKPTLALSRRGVRYVELRSVDLDCFEPAGASLTQLRVLEVFLLTCLLLDSPPLSREEKAACSRNALAVACCGRRPDFALARDGREVALRHWAGELVEGMRAVATTLDASTSEGTPYADSLSAVCESIEEPDATPSARVLAQLRAEKTTFAQYGLELSARHARTLGARPLAGEREEEFNREAERSLREQARIEAEDDMNFDNFLQRYFAQS